MDYMQAFKDGRIVVRISANEEANFLYQLLGDVASYANDDYEQFPYVIAYDIKCGNGYHSLETAMKRIRNRNADMCPIVVDFAELFVCEESIQKQYDDISLIL